MSLQRLESVAVALAFLPNFLFRQGTTTINTIIIHHSSIHHKRPRILPHSPTEARNLPSEVRSPQQNKGQRGRVLSRDSLEPRAQPRSLPRLAHPSRESRDPPPLVIFHTAFSFRVWPLFDLQGSRVSTIPLGRSPVWSICSPLEAVTDQGWSRRIETNVAYVENRSPVRETEGKDALQDLAERLHRPAAWHQPIASLIAGLRVRARFDDRWKSMPCSNRQRGAEPGWHKRARVKVRDPSIRWHRHQELRRCFFDGSRHELVRARP
ncbi:hypothetical protein G7046_g9360 [Stylonectria norvegica]|nr:hypothetical protein G7046_g9360 [Stylonectria norvegica]